MWNDWIAGAEVERPREWLESLERGGHRWLDLLEECEGHLALAAHRVAAARLRAWHRAPARPVPTVRELHVAAREVHERANAFGHVPNKLELAEAARDLGLEVM